MKETAIREPLSRTAFYVIIIGWIAFGLFVLIEYAAFDMHFFDNLLNIRYPASALHLFMLLFPFITTALGYLINERGKLMKELLASDSKLKAALSEWRFTFDSMPHGVMLVDEELKILRINKHISDLYGRPIKDIVNKKCGSLDDAGDGLPLAVCQNKAAKSAETTTTEHLDNRLGRHFMLYSTPVVHGGVKSFVHSVVDITELKEKEKKLTAGKAAFFNMLKDLDITNKELMEIFNGLTFAFADALDAKSPWTRGHSERVTSLAVSIANEMNLSDKEIETLRTASILHDIGKIGTYDEILDKPGRLTDEEFTLVKQHPGKGADFLKHIRKMEEVALIIRHHHERFDGKGYPDGLKSEEIPFLARIITVADSLDAMIAERPYRPPLSWDSALNELRTKSGAQFDPAAVEAFFSMIQNPEFTPPVQPLTAGNS